jgi:hypothetical protein
LEEEMLDVYKTTVPILQINITNELSQETLEILTILATNVELRKYLLIDQKPFDFIKLSEMTKAKQSSLII